MLFDTDVFVIGGGPAGLASAIAARKRGFSVTLADSCTPPIDKACGEGLMPDSLAAARQLGIEIPERLGFRFRGICFRSNSHNVAAAFPQGEGKAIRRTALHAMLVEAAAKAGVRLLWGCSVNGIDGHWVRLQGQAVVARWIVGADGGQSMVRQWAGLSQIRRQSRRFGFRRHYQTAPWSDYLEIHWSDGCQFYITGVAPAEICVALISRDPHFRIDDALPRFPVLANRLRGVPPSTTERGSFAATRRWKHITKGHVVLVGDASGTVDAITGEGMCLAFQQTVALAEALERGNLRYYEIAHARLARRPVFMADFMLTMDASPRILRGALNAFSRRPELFSDLLAGHLGWLDLARFAATAGALGWEIVSH
jgi:menaquinone-9 beta-reductase